LDANVPFEVLLNPKELPAKSESQTNLKIPTYSSIQGSINSRYLKESENEDPKENGIYPATVHYYNRNTGFSAEYNLEVEVIDGEATTIYWPNGGYSDVNGDPDKEYEIEMEE
jgi:hypothetical protein